MESTGRFTPALKALRAQSYDKCQSCGSQLQKEVAAYAGYTKDGEPCYVGPCCLKKISELASHIYWWWEVDKRVEPGAKLWRYMDLSKFLHLLENRALFFARADNLGDPFEGASGVADRESEWDKFYLEFFSHAVRNPPSGDPPSDHEVEAQATRLLRQMRASAEEERKNTFVSCWHANDCESEALWRLYCPPNSTGVAIETTAERLTSALGDSDIELGQVQYVDFRRSFAGLHDRIFWKRSSLRHEAEVRAVFKQWSGQEVPGLSKFVDIENLCVSVVPSPFAANWFGPLVKSITERYALDLNVTKSELLSQPFF
jgi:hypothetical protein